MKTGREFWIFLNEANGKRLTYNQQFLPLPIHIYTTNNSIMPDVFISYATSDADFANYVCSKLRSQKLNVFMAPISLEPGRDWSNDIHEALRNSNWVIFLASKKAVKSEFVLQEVGSAIIGNKTLIPVVWDIPPSQLPGWAKNYQAIDLRNDTPIEIMKKIGQLAIQIRTKKRNGMLIGGALITGLFILSAVGENTDEDEGYDK